MEKGKSEMGKGKPHLTERLYQRIYNPELPPNWSGLPDHEKVFMFHKLFLLLNEDFQKEFGKELDEWFSIWEAQRDRNMKYLLNHPWLEVDDLGGTLYKICCECAKNGPCRMGIHKDDLIDILLRRDQGGAAEIEGGKILRSRFFEASVRLPSSVTLSPEQEGELKKLLPPHKNLADHDVALFKEHLEELRKGNIPKEIYPTVKIYYSKKRLIQDFGECIDEIQKLYFDKYPHEKSPEYGHLELKADRGLKKRKKTYYFDEWARYYKVHVLNELKKSRKEIAGIYPNTVDKDSIPALIISDRKKAENLIKNAWTNSFPGKY